MGNSLFNAYSQYYDLLYRDKDYSSEVDYIYDLLTRFGISGIRILEFGSGTGQHGRLLAKRGFEVMGIDLSPEMVARSEEVHGFSCIQGDVCSIKLGRTFDTVLSLFHVLSYQVTNDCIISVFERASDHLETGGLFIFDVWYSPAVYGQKPEVRVKRMANESMEITRIAEPILLPNENRVDVQYTIISRDLKSGAVDTMYETHPMRHFSLPELKLLARMTGFSIIGSEEFFTGRLPSENTWSVCFVLKKV